ncbi:MAG: carbohydrate binding domain-containing protein [Actinobacteria bacterium]|nr:carbohydrate binding domain-containing protein [Actinomycetota bacterium]
MTSTPWPINDPVFERASTAWLDGVEYATDGLRYTYGTNKLTAGMAVCDPENGWGPSANSVIHPGEGRQGTDAFDLQVPSPNLLNADSSGLENGTAGWGSSNSSGSVSSLEVSAEEAYSGSHSLKITIDDSGTNPSYPRFRILGSERPYVTAEVEHTFSAWVKYVGSEVSPTINLTYMQYDVNDDNISGTKSAGEYALQAGVWTHVSGTFTPVAGTVRIMIGLRPPEQVGVWYCDDIFIQETISSIAYRYFDRLGDSKDAARRFNPNDSIALTCYVKYADGSAPTFVGDGRLKLNLHGSLVTELVSGPDEDGWYLIGSTTNRIAGELNDWGGSAAIGLLRYDADSTMTPVLTSQLMLSTIGDSGVWQPGGVRAVLVEEDVTNVEPDGMLESIQSLAVGYSSDAPSAPGTWGTNQGGAYTTSVIQHPYWPRKALRQQPEPGETRSGLQLRAGSSTSPIPENTVITVSASGYANRPIGIRAFFRDDPRETLTGSTSMQSFPAGFWYYEAQHTVPAGLDSTSTYWQAFADGGSFADDEYCDWYAFQTTAEHHATSFTDGYRARGFLDAPGYTFPSEGTLQLDSIFPNIPAGSGDPAGYGWRGRTPIGLSNSSNYLYIQVWDSRLRFISKRVTNESTVTSSAWVGPSNNDMSGKRHLLTLTWDIPNDLFCAYVDDTPMDGGISSASHLPFAGTSDLTLRMAAQLGSHGGWGPITGMHFQRRYMTQQEVTESVSAGGFEITRDTISLLEFEETLDAEHYRLMEESVGANLEVNDTGQTIVQLDPVTLGASVNAGFVSRSIIGDRPVVFRNASGAIVRTAAGTWRPTRLYTVYEDPEA